MAQQVRLFNFGKNKRFYIRFFVNKGFSFPFIHYCRKHGLKLGKNAEGL